MVTRFSSEEATPSENIAPSASVAAPITLSRRPTFPGTIATTLASQDTLE